MSNESANKLNDLYLRVWEWSSEHGRIRWTVATFFIGISFAIFGFSFRAEVKQPLLLAQRFTAIGIYWFAYALFMRFHKYTSFLRKYLRELEEQGKTDYNLQTKIDEEMEPGRKWKSSERLLLYFGLIYTVGMILISMATRG